MPIQSSRADPSPPEVASELFASAERADRLDEGFLLAAKLLQLRGPRRTGGRFPALLVEELADF
jgi:hypothetical protein